MSASQERFGPEWLSTNAIKDTVSVLYWYEELSTTSGNFWEGSSDLFFVHFWPKQPWLNPMLSHKQNGAAF